MDPTPTLRMRIAPAPQQGGTQTIQQTINLTHDNPCGYNPVFELTMGDTGITYEEFAYMLNSLFLLPQTNEALNVYIDALKEQVADPNETNEQKAILALYNYGLSIQENANLPDIPGYEYIYSVYDANGATLLDTSLSSAWPPVVQTGVNTYDYTLLTLQTYSNPIPAECRVYNLLYQPSLINWIDGAVGNQSEIINSSYIVNQNATSESVMSTASLLTDTANTRAYKLPGFGFSARPYSPQNSNPSYNVCYMKRIFDTGKILSSFFVRLTLIQT